MTKSPTGRLHTEPNLQSLTYPKEEHICIDLDYSSIELRIAAQIGLLQVNGKILKKLLYSKDLDFHEIFKSILLKKY